MKDILVEMGLCVMDRDEAFYFFHKDGVLLEAILTHVDDFNLAETDEFVEEIISKVEQNLIVSKVEKNKFRFTGLDVCAVENGIEITIDDYIMSLEDVAAIRKADCEDWK